MGEILNEKTRFDGQAELWRVEVRLTTSQRRIDIIGAAFLEPGINVNHRTASDYKGRIRGICT